MSKLFPLTSSVLNGTVTMSTDVCAVRAETAEEAFKKAVEHKKDIAYDINHEKMTFRLKQEDDCPFVVWCELKDREISVIGE